MDVEATIPGNISNMYLTVQCRSPGSIGLSGFNGDSIESQCGSLYEDIDTSNSNCTENDQENK